MAALGLLLVGAATAAFVAWKQGRLPWAPGAEVAAPGPVVAETASFEFAVYFLSTSEDLSPVLDGLLAREFSAFTRVAASPDGRKGPQLSARLLKDVPESYAPPSVEMIGRFGRGLSPAQAEALQHAREAFVLDFGLPREKVWEGGRLACRLVGALARRSGGIVWDEETREVFTPEAWEERRIVPWTQPLPDVSEHTVIHAYQDGEFVRAISLGMAKFGMPDLVVENFSWSLNRNVGHLINLTAQAMAEGAEVRSGGELRLRLADIQNEDVREPQLASLKSKGTGDVVLSLRKATPEEGDPRNRLLEIVFDRFPGADVHSRQDSLMSTFFGFEDAVTPVRHDAEVLAASARARAKLPEVHRAFAAGLKPGEYVLVKAPFRTLDGGNEWMWVEVTSWKKTTIGGSLQNEPAQIPTLHAGQLVTVPEGDVFDYIVRHADGTEEGNETRAFIEAQQGAARATAKAP